MSKGKTIYECQACKKRYASLPYAGQCPGTPDGQYACFGSILAVRIDELGNVVGWAGKGDG